MSCENDKIRRRTRALDASTTEAARGGLINHLSTDRKNEHKHNSLQRARRTVCVGIPTAHIVSVSCPLKIIENQVKKHTHTHTQCERTEIDCRHISLQRPKTVRIARSTFSEHVSHREQRQKKRSIVQVCDAFHKASRHNASRRTWAGSGRRLAMDCVTKEKPCLRRCHGITHKQRRTHTELPIASLFPVPLPSADTENTRKMVSRDQLCGKPHNPCRYP